jgi:hypothetical protein
LGGPAPKTDKILYRELVRRGTKNRHIPPELRDTVVARSKRDKFGQIRVRRMSGLVKNPAVNIVRKFEEMAGSKADILEKLQAVPEGKLNVEDKLLIDLLEKGGQKSLSRLVAEAKASPARLLRLYADGATALGKIQAAVEVSRNQPQIVKDLMRHALDQEGICKTCVGTGTVKARADSKSEGAQCPSCEGSGRSLRPSKIKPWAMDKVLEIGKIVDKKGPGRPSAEVHVTQQVGVRVANEGSFLENQLKTSDEILYGRRRPQKVIEAEVVSSEGSGSESESA